MPIVDGVGKLQVSQLVLIPESSSTAVIIKFFKVRILSSDLVCFNVDPKIILARWHLYVFVFDVLVLERNETNSTTVCICVLHLRAAKYESRKIYTSLRAGRGLLFAVLTVLVYFSFFALLSFLHHLVSSRCRYWGRRAGAK